MKKWILLLVMMFSMPTQAAIEIYQFENPAHEELYKQMIDELRCLVCQNQNLSASNAALAQDLRQQTYEMILRGQSHDEIVAYMTQRYGDFVLYRPPFKLMTALLWLGPLLLLFISIWVLITTLKKEKGEAGKPLSDEQHAHIKQLLENGET
ncbi:MAG: cytochrome c-type biogenesis protein CcmH [Methylophagaceae bacterium]